MKIKSIAYLAALILATQLCFGEPTKKSTEKKSETVLVRIPGAEVVSEDAEDSNHLSKTFTVAALKSVSTLREWHSHLSITIQNGYPPSEYWIGADRDRAAEAIRLALLAASTDADTQVVEQLTKEFGTLESWSMQCLDGYKNLRMARYYMSPAALENDTQFQHSAQCTQTLLTVLSKGEVTEQPLCR